MKLLITGAAGGLATLLRPRMARPGRVLRLLDIAPLTAGDAEEVVTASVTDLAAMTDACDGVDAVLHLGGLSTEHPWDRILDVNIHGTYCVLEAARRAGVARVVFASSNHAVGFLPTGPAPDYAFPRPDTFYGVSKVAGEALGSLYHDRYGLDVVCVRIGSCFDRPTIHRMLATWLSPDDAARLVESALTATGFHIVWGVSANTRATWSQDAAAAIGYVPRDNAEDFADDVGDPDPYDHYLGGGFCSPELDMEGRA